MEKVSGDEIAIVKGKRRKAELHWHQATGAMNEMKVKRWENES